MLDPDAQAATLLCTRLLGVSLIIQSAELLWIESRLVTGAIWRWNTLQAEFSSFPGAFQALLRCGFEPSRFKALQLLHMLAATTLLMSGHPLPLLFLLFATVMTHLRFRGTFNGGSDFMTLVVLSALTVSSLAGTYAPSALSERIKIGALWYIAFHACASYFVAGWTKLRRPNWRSGRALQGFASASIYEVSISARAIQSNRALALLASWTVMLWEVSFPLALVDPWNCAAFLGLGLLFHLGNAHLFGLNRFFFAWLAAYPALLFVARSLSGG